MEGTEVVVFVQVARKILVYEKPSLYGVIAVLAANFIYTFFKLALLVVGVVEQTQLNFRFVAKAYCADGDSSQRTVEMMQLL